MMHPDTIQQVHDFRNELYILFGKRADALFELCDAAVTAGLSPSLACLGLDAVHRRGWGSTFSFTLPAMEGAYRGTAESIH